MNYIYKYLRERIVKLMRSRMKIIVFIMLRPNLGPDNVYIFLYFKGAIITGLLYLKFLQLVFYWF